MSETTEYEGANKVFYNLRPIAKRLQSNNSTTVGSLYLTVM